MSYARLRKAVGEIEQAGAQLTQAIDMCRQTGMVRELEPAEQAL